MKNATLRALCLLAMAGLCLPGFAQTTATQAAKPAAPKPAATTQAAKPAAKTEAAKPAAKSAEIQPVAEKAAPAAAPKAKSAKAAPAKAATAKPAAAPEKAAAKKPAVRRARRAAAPKLVAPAIPANTVPAWWAYPRTTGNWPARHAGFVAQARKGGVDFLAIGDSITDGWNKQPELWNKAFGPLKAANFGIGGDRTENIVWRITNGELNGIHPKVIMMLIGTNNTSKGDSAENIARGVATIVNIMRTRLPEAKILLLGVYPRGEKPADAKTAAYRENIKQVNAIISKMDDGKNVRYIYFGDKFLAQDGTIPKALMPDFLHLSKDGYQIWIDSVMPVVQEMMK